MGIKTFEIDQSKNSRRIFSCDGGFEVITHDGKTYILGGNGDPFNERTQHPEFKHDCDKCMFLFSYTNPDGTHSDFYFCSNEPTIVDRYGNEGPEYRSGLDLCSILPGFARARAYLECLPIKVEFLRDAVELYSCKKCGAFKGEEHEFGCEEGIV